MLVDQLISCLGWLSPCPNDCRRTDTQNTIQPQKRIRVDHPIPFYPPPASLSLVYDGASTHTPHTPHLMPVGIVAEVWKSVELNQTSEHGMAWHGTQAPGKNKSSKIKIDMLYYVIAWHVMARNFPSSPLLSSNVSKTRWTSSRYHKS